MSLDEFKTNVDETIAETKHIFFLNVLTIPHIRKNVIDDWKKWSRMTMELIKEGAGG